MAALNPITVAKIKMVLPEGLEPPRLAAQEPKSCVSANSTTGAQREERSERDEDLSNGGYIHYTGHYCVED